MKIKLNKSLLYKEYIINRKTLQQIAKETNYGITTIWKKLNFYNIKPRTISEANGKWSNILTKKFLIKEYIKNQKSTIQIAKEIGCNEVTVCNYLKLFKIKIRTYSESSKLINKKGKNSPNYIDGRCSKIYHCKEEGCNNEICYDTWKNGQGRCRSCAHKQAYEIGKLNNKGNNNGNWQGGIGKEPYPFKFDKQLKEQIRQRDNHQCQICGKSTKKNGRKMTAHHIDYNKDNLNPNNLISLCQFCHGKTNYNREIYIEYFKILTNIIFKINEKINL